MFVAQKQDGVDIVLQLTVEALGQGLGAALYFRVMADPGIDIGMDDGVPDVMAHVAGGIGHGLLPLLGGFHPGDGQQEAAEEVLDVGFVHEHADVAVVPVPGQGNVIKEDIRPLEPQLEDKAVAAHHVLKISGKKVMEGLHSHNIMCCKSGHKTLPVRAGSNAPASLTNI